MKKPLLTIGIIFKDDIRCIERCLKALRPLRDAIPCELIMADTGSCDGSRQVAERYADQVFDFPWVDDFAAARNAVMDRGAASWYFSVDTDEYLDSDVRELAAFLESAAAMPAKRRPDGATVFVRNYYTYEMDGEYSDFMAVRILNRGTGARFVGSIHEHWEDQSGRQMEAYPLKSTVLRHDGYVELEKKVKRNLPLLRKRIEAEPEDVLAWLQLMESGRSEPDYPDMIHSALELIWKKARNWEQYGAPVLRFAVDYAAAHHLPETAEWIQKAEEWFPASAFTCIDVQFIAFFEDWNSDNYAGCIRRGEFFLQALEDDEAGKLDPYARMYSKIQRTERQWVQILRIALACAYTYENNPQQAAEILFGTDLTDLDEKPALLLGQLLGRLQLLTDLDLTAQTKDIWKAINATDPNSMRRTNRRAAFLKTAVWLFSPDYIRKEVSQSDFHRHGYTVFLPLKDRCDLGRAAAILETDQPDALEQTLSKVEKWDQFPIHALYHALECGVKFPPAEVPLNIEEMDSLADRLAQEQDRLLSLVRCSTQPGKNQTGQCLAWIRGLALAAVQNYDWGADPMDASDGMSLARSFADIERHFLPCCYTSKALQKDGLYMLPPLHRFGWYCAQAFGALGDGDSAGYVRLLREGLTACTVMKPMVEFLTRHTPELQAPPPSAELLAIARQIRTLLAAYSPDDPAVVALKQSEAYQMVAYLIEDAELLMAGGQSQ